MPDRKITLRRNNAGTSEAMYPTTTTDQVMTSNGSTAVFGSDNKLKYNYLPEGIVGGLKFQETRTAADLDSDQDIANLMDYLLTEYGATGMIGAYYIASENLTVDTNGNATQASGGGNWWQTQAFDQDSVTGEEEPDDSTQLELETGDWLVIQKVTGAGTSSSDPYKVEFGVINNTYQNATTNQKGIVELATNDETDTGTDTSLAVTPAGLASVLSGYSTTNTTYTTSAVDSGANAIIRLTGSDSSTEDITLVAGDNMTITPSGDNITLASAHPSISAASSVNNSGRTYIQDITLDSNGHITGITSATETVTNTDTNDYLDGISKSGNTLTFSVGSQTDVTYDFGSNAFTSTTIPSVTLNGSASTSPNFYAPTASGSAGSSSATRQALFSNGNSNAPTFVEAPKIFYDTTTGWLHGDIVLDVDA